MIDKDNLVFYSKQRELFSYDPNFKKINFLMTTFQIGVRICVGNKKMPFGIGIPNSYCKNEA